ncbi:MAG: six-cysteine ranthipeptide SCIFF [Clostridia bacterium]|nr:six-cysteine peptide SCIFF [Clostridiales bacterium]MBR2614574.1 six-cysteine ranthipeptide SCIFF [Clostridia bacterium]
MAKIKLVATPKKRTSVGCGECRSTCQSACKTSCTVGNQNCEKLEREAKVNNK